MYTKAQIFNLALNALQLSRRITDTDTDKSNENQVLLTQWDTAFKSTIADLDLDTLSTTQQGELVASDPNDQWLYAYKYPVNCARFRRIVSGLRKDNRDTFIEKQVAIFNGAKVIYTDQQYAVFELIPSDVPLAFLSPFAARAAALALAILAAPLITGKGSKSLIEKLEKAYAEAKAEAQRLDAEENFGFVDPDVESEFVAARID